MPPGGWCSMPDQRHGGGRASHGPRKAAAMLSSTSTRAPSAALAQHERGASSDGQRKGPLGKRDESSRASWRRRQLGQPAMEQVAAGQRARVAQGQQGRDVACASFTSLRRRSAPDGLFGGGERYPLELARALARAGRVRADHLRSPAARSSASQADCASARCAPWPGWAAIRRIRSRPACSRRCRGRRRRPHPSYAQPAQPHGRRGRPRPRASAPVVTDHGLQGGDWGGLLPRLFDAFLTVSAYSARELGAPPARTRVIYGGADPTRYAPDPAVPRSGVLFVGRLTPHKGVDVCSQALPAGAALASSAPTGHDPRLPERDYPHLLQRARARARGRVPGPRARCRPAGALPLGGGARAARRSSAPATAGRARLGAARPGGARGDGQRHAGRRQSRRRRARDRPGRRDRLPGQPGNVAELRERLAQVLGDPALGARLGANAREAVLERFTWRRGRRALPRRPIRSPSRRGRRAAR